MLALIMTLLEGFVNTLCSRLKFFQAHRFFLDNDGVGQK
jgi:hypothetical protein